MVIPTETSNSHNKFPASKPNEKAGRKIRKIAKVVRNISGKLTPVYVLKSTRLIDKTTLSSVKEPACKIAAKIGSKKFIFYGETGSASSRLLAYSFTLYSSTSYGGPR